MAKRRNRKGQFTKGHGGGHARRRSPGTAIVRYRPSAPTTIRVAAPAAPRRKSGGRRRHVVRHSLGKIGSFFGGSKSGHRTAIIISSAVLGWAQKEGWLAKLPVIGKAGPITSFGLLGWGAEEFLKLSLPPIVSDMVTSALALSAFNIGLSGGETIVGGYQAPGGAVFFD